MTKKDRQNKKEYKNLHATIENIDYIIHEHFMRGAVSPEELQNMLDKHYDHLMRLYGVRALLKSHIAEYELAGDKVRREDD